MTSPFKKVLTQVKWNAHTLYYYPEFPDEIRMRMATVYHLAKERIALARQEAKRQYDKKSKYQVAFSVNQLVYLKNIRKTLGLSHKFDVKYIGPYIIRGILSNVSAKLENPQTKKIILAHVNRLKPMYNQRGQLVFDSPDDLSMESAQETTPNFVPDSQNQQSPDSAQDSGNDPQRTSQGQRPATELRREGSAPRKRVRFSEEDSRIISAGPADSLPSTTEQSLEQRSLRQVPPVYYGASSRDWINQHRWTQRPHNLMSRNVGSSLSTTTKVRNQEQEGRMSNIGGTQAEIGNNAETRETTNATQRRAEDVTQDYPPQGAARTPTINRESDVPAASNQHNAANACASARQEVTHEQYNSPPLPPRGVQPNPPPLPPPSPLITRSFGASRRNSRPSQLRQNPPLKHKSFRKLFSKGEK